ncbi:MAG: acyltransferase family protein [Lachnospiraceae bacterium]|nr:acyltransferase family protein [Lachnospiraceae bacterium]
MPAETEKQTISSAKPYYPEVDILKGIAIFLVILGHAIIVYPVNLHSIPWCSAIYEWVESVHMPLFFLVSGFCFSYHEEKNGHFTSQYKQYLSKKVRRILIPYLIFCLADALTRILFPALVNRDKGFWLSVYDIIFGGGGYWFLYTLFMLFLVFPFLHLLRKNYPWIRIPLFVCILVLPFVPNIPEIFLIRLNVHYLPFFYVGYLLRQHMYLLNRFSSWPKQAKENHQQVPFLVTALMAGLLFMLWIFFMGINGSSTSTPLAMVIAFIGILFFYLLVKSRLIALLSPAFRAIGIYSLQLYLFNGYLLVISRLLICTICGVTSPIVIIAFNMLIDLGFSYVVIHYVVSRVKLFRFLCGILS